ncbi:MAG: hypothetical protein K0Q60_5001, partial [Microvirga sp.]|nr:hypothetical protein [Microvirga sp.]
MDENQGKTLIPGDFVEEVNPVKARSC